MCSLIRAATNFNLVPRGHGRGTFRLAETIQVGSIPVHLFNDFPWIPYAGTYASVEAIGMLGKVGQLHKIVKKIATITANDCNGTYIKEMRLKVLSIRHYYTIPGVMEQIKLFINDPLGPTGGLLRCAALHPNALEYFNTITNVVGIPPIHPNWK